MSAQELAFLLQAMKENPLELAVPLPQARQNFDTMLATLPVAPDLKFDNASANGVPGIWSEAPGADRDRVVLYFHGGGYVLGTAHGYRSLVGEIGRAAKARSFAIDYRLAPEHPFPAAIDDAVTAYRWLLDQGISPGSIGFAGDSAGGGLTVTTLIALRDLGLPLPAGGVMISPWIDLDNTGASMTGKASADPALEKQGLDLFASGYRLGITPETPRQHLLAPLAADLRGLPPLLIQVGTAEVLLDDSTRLATKAAADDVATQLAVWPQMIHVWHMFGFMLSEARDAVRQAGDFLQAQFART
jgi:acetyl esterase/lipase